jgi:ABC-type glycerol-3-phosphate transport system permease component
MIGRADRGWRKGVLHLALVFGSALFVVPFLWLLSSSFKMPDEMYPPRWVPPGPDWVSASPYIGLADNRRPVQPIGVSDADWARSSGAVRSVIAGRIGELKSANVFPAFYVEHLDDPLLVEGIFAMLLRRTPDALFEKVTAVSEDWFYQETTEAVVREVFEQVYRRVALGGIEFHAWDLSKESATEEGVFVWESVDANATLIPREAGLLQPAQEVHYDFSQTDTFQVRAVLPLAMGIENFKKMTVSNHSDRSWHRIWATIESGGKRWHSIQPALLGSDRWQDTTWQLPSTQDEAIELRNWQRMAADGTSDIADANTMRITLTYQYDRPLLATVNKYTLNYREVMRLIPVWRYVGNSVYLVVLNLVGQIIGSSLVAFAFARLRWPGRDFYFVLVLATLMIPPQVTMIPVFLVVKELGWYNTMLPLWVPSFFGSAFFIFLLRQFMKGIPRDLEDSAKIDGCGYWGIYWRIIMPLVKPALATIGIFTFMAVWNEFMGPLIYLTDQVLYPLSLGLFALQAVHVLSPNHGLMMAAAVLMTAPVIAIFFVAQRQFIQGITLTGLKG